MNSLAGRRLETPPAFQVCRCSPEDRKQEGTHVRHLRPLDAGVILITFQRASLFTHLNLFKPTCPRRIPTICEAARLATENVMQTRIKATDAQMNKLVYGLYGLKDAEIAVVEGAG